MHSSSSFNINRGVALLILAGAVLLIGAFSFSFAPVQTKAQGSGTPITGYAWSDTVGWISMNCSNDSSCGTSNYGLAIDTNGKLSGYAWSDNVGWIDANEDDLSGCPQTPCRAKMNGNDLNGWLKVLAATALQGGGTPQTTLLTSGTSWTVPADWNSSDNTIETIGGGGSSSATGGGGGGAYSAITNLSLTPGAAVTYAIGAGGSSGSDGGSTYFDGSSCGPASVCAKGGGGTSNHNGASGGSASSSGGTTKYSGGDGGDRGSNNVGGGGGGAAGSHGAGGDGGTAQSGSGGSAGGSGDAGYGGTGGSCGSPGQGGTAGAGGTEYDSTHGSGGGGCGGSTTGIGGAGGLYGGGGGGGGSGYAGGSGVQGIIAITYTPAGSAPQSGGWDGWISLSGTGYGPTVSGGVFSGYAWGSDVVGWVDFANVLAEFGTCTPAYSCTNSTTLHSTCPLPSGTDTTCASGKTCSVNACIDTYSCLDTHTIQNNYTGATTACPAPLICSSGSSSCVAAAAMQAVPFGDYSGHLQAHPSLVLEGDTTFLFWNIENADEPTCSVKDSNNVTVSSGASSSGENGVETDPIEAQTVFTLRCTGEDGEPLIETATVNVVPLWVEF